MKFSNKFAALSALGMGALASVPAHAAATDFSTLTAGVDFSTATVAILAVGAILAGVGVAIKGTRKVLSMIGG